MASGPITSWQIDGETMKTVTDFIFLGSKITADGGCSHKTKRHFLLRRKAVTNLDSILKSRDITLPTKVCLVKTIVFSIVIYGCEHWTIKSGEELVLLNCGVGEDSWVPSTSRRSNQSILKEISPEYSLEGLMLKLKLQYFGHLMQRTDSLEKTLMLGNTEGRKRRGWLRTMFGWHHWLIRPEREQAPEVGNGLGSLACCSPWGCKESDTTEWLNWTELNWTEVLNNGKSHWNIHQGLLHSAV